MRTRREARLLLFALAVIGVLGGSHARPSEGVAVQLEEEYPVYDVVERQKQEEEGSPGSAGSEGTFGSWWSERRPCACANARCACCTGTVFPLPPWLRPRVCTNLTYIQDEFALKMAITFNDVVMYRNKVSGRNPPPVCISPPRIRRAKLCVKLQDVYLIERNVHACMSVEGLYNNQVLFGRMLGCMRMGANGVAVVNPEDGGGLPLVEPVDPDDEEPNDEDDYDQVDEDYDPVVEDNTVEPGAAEEAGAKGGGRTDAAGVEEGPAKTSGGGETQNTTGAEGSVEDAEAPVKVTEPLGAKESPVVAESVHATETEGTSNTTRSREAATTTRDEDLPSTTVAEGEAVYLKENEQADAGSSTVTEETTIDDESPSTTTGMPDEMKKTGGSKEEDRNASAVGTWKEAMAAGGEENEKSTASHEKSTEADDTMEELGETKGPDGSKDDVAAENEDLEFFTDEGQVPKGIRDLLDEEIVGVGTVQEL